MTRTGFSLRIFDRMIYQLAIAKEMIVGLNSPTSKFLKTDKVDTLSRKFDKINATGATY